MRPESQDGALGEVGQTSRCGIELQFWMDRKQPGQLARAFLRDAPLLLLDEPTAGLDGATEAQVLDAVRRLARGRTVVLAVHRPALVALADRVVTVHRAGVRT